MTKLPPRPSSRPLLFIVIYGLLFALFALASWALAAPNLIFTEHPLYWDFQWFMWHNFYNQRPLVTIVYALFIVGFGAIFYLLLRHRWSSWRSLTVSIAIALIPLFFAFNALSFDVFNYQFNAKMIAVYHADPHQHVALDFPADSWLQHMHNVHTPAPYGYGFTVLSLIPYYLGAGKLAGTWLAFRFCGVLLFLGTCWLLAQFLRRLQVSSSPSSLALFALHPLVLIEMIANTHNDLWMMLPALAALYLLYPDPRSSRRSWWRLFVALLLFALSASIKFATLTLLPAFAFLLVLPIKNQLLGSLPAARKFLERSFNFLTRYFFDGCALLMFLPLLTPRSQLFHPWYLTWSLCFLPLSHSRFVRRCLLVLSFSSLFRYLPYLWDNGYAQYTLSLSQAITWAPLAIYLLAVGIRWSLYSRKS